ncbi:hypothetical protein IC582_013613 [Cucumis melo]
MADSQSSDGGSERRSSVISRRGTNGTMNVIFTDPQILDCYICWNPCQFLFSSFACVCCCTKVQNKCPSCILAIGYIRCRAIEKVLESIKLPCKNAIYRCKTAMDLNLINDQETLRRYEPCSCPLDNCTFVGLAEQLYLHFSRRHKNSAKHFSYNTRFTICLNNGDTYRILKAEDDGVLFFLSYTFEIFGNAITVNWIGPLSSEKKFSYKINENTG